MAKWGDKEKSAGRKATGKVVIPTSPNSFDVAADKLNFYLYAVPGFGKTTIVSQMFPDALFLATDIKGQRFLQVRQMPVSTWQEFLDILEELEDNKDTAPVCIDVIDILYTLCLSHVCAVEGCDYPSDDKRKGTIWFNVRNEFQRAILRLVNLDVGVVFIGHLDESVRRIDDKDVVISKPAISPMAFEIVSKLVDITACGIFESEYNKETKKTTERRVLQLMPNSSVSAKTRLGTLPETCAFDAKSFKKAIRTSVAELIKSYQS